LIASLRDEIELVSSAARTAEIELRDKEIDNLRDRLRFAETELATTSQLLAIAEMALAEERDRSRQLAKSLSNLTATIEILAS